MTSLKLIEDLTNAFGPSGFEDEVVEVAKKYINAQTFEDSTRNLYIGLEKETTEKTAEQLRIMIDAHTDEVGMMVHYIKTNGTIAFTPLAGFLPAAFVAQKVLIKNREGDLITGIVTSKPPHFAGKKDYGQIEIEDLSIDIGASSKAEVEQDYKIKPGCPIAPATKFEYNQKRDLMLAKAFDCRLGVAAVIDVMNNLPQTQAQVVGTLTAQEEIGVRGAVITTRRVNPDIAIVFEGSPADDSILDSHMVQTALGKGPMLRYLDGGMITHPRFIAYAIEIAKKNNIPIQESVRTKSGTNGKAIHLSNLGVPTIVISIPVRYIHTHHCFAKTADYKNAIALATAIVKDINRDIVNGF
ncbi:MAG: M42 family peptidase [Defluviitaleaceae bacterium]|nr:M42 family peptidase [Defluviitaleaceae bacterium]